MDYPGSYWIKMDQIGSNHIKFWKGPFEKTCCQKHFLRKKHALKKLILKNKHVLKKHDLKKHEFKKHVL